MKINSFKKAILCGLVYGLLTFLVYVLYTHIIHWILGGEYFVDKSETREVINGLSFLTTLMIGTILSALIPIFLLRYRSITHYIVCFFIAIVTYVGLFLGMYIAPGLNKFFFELIKTSPMNSFDALIYGAFYFPLGSIIGIVLNGGINFWMNRKR